MLNQFVSLVSQQPLSRRSLPSLVCAALICATGSFAAAQYDLKQHDGGVQVLRDGELIADYLTLSKSKPIIWPLVGPGSARMTRDYPMKEAGKHERDDHPHHRSLWFTHGDVNGTDFWLEGEKGGIQEHQEFTELKSGATAVIATTNIWKTPAGKPVLTDQRSFTFGDSGSDRYVDCHIVLKATHGDVNFGDTKEGTFGIRIAGSMKVDAKSGGQIVNSKGDQNQKAWGVPAEWVDYVGPIDGQTMGIAIFCHPSTFNYPNRWHVRTYGLFAANPFGVHHFIGQDKPTEGVDLSAGQSMNFRYRVLMHRGDTEEAEVAQRYAEFSKAE